MADFTRLFQNYENVLEPQECKLTGSVPSFLKGTLLRNGPGLFTIGDNHYDHWFDGPAYIQRYHFEDGKMFYSARFLESDCYKASMKAQRITESQFGTFKYTDPCKSIFHRFFSYFKPDKTTDNTSVSFATIGDGIYAVTETPYLNRIDPDTLDRLEKVDIGKYITLHTYTAHHNNDYEGNTYNIGTHFDASSWYAFAVTENPKNKKSESSHSTEHTRLVGKFPSTDSMSPSYYHSFGMSENYILLFEAPVRISVKKLIMRKIQANSFKDTFSWEPEKGVNVLIMDKNNGKRLKFKVKSAPFFTFHHANSFEKDGFLVVDYCKMLNPGDFSDFSVVSISDGFFNNMNEEFKAYLHRMVIPLSIPPSAKAGDNLLDDHNFANGCSAVLQKDGSVFVTDKRICDEPFEFPRYHYEKYNMREYKYVYGTSLLANSEKLVGIVKANVQDGTHIYHKRDNNTQLCAEPIFIPTPDGVEEDDGILLVPVMTTVVGDHPFVLILDAKNLQELARFEIPEERIPMGFHAMYASR